ncbi:hypothetical protein ABPG75_000423 [Micractinium tetrahymenae]
MQAWRAVGTPTRVAAYYPALAVHPAGTVGTPMLAFAVGQCSRCLISYAGLAQIFTPVGWLPLGLGFGDGPVPGQEFRLALHPNSRLPYVAYRDEENGGVLNMWKWNTTTWLELGLTGQPNSTAPLGLTNSTVTAVNLDYSSLSWGPISCFADSDHNGRASCLRGVGPQASSFTYVGTPGFSPSAAAWVSMAVHGSAIFVAFQDFASTKGRVMRFQSGGSWQLLGAAFSSGAASYLSLALHPGTGLPWVAFLGAAPGSPTPPSPKLTVVALTALAGGQWKAVGASGFAGQGSVYNALAFEPGTQLKAPWLAFQCDSVARRLCVRSWVNNAWQPMGAQPVSVGEARFINLQFHAPSSTPYLAYSNQGVNGGAAVVRRWG